MQRHMRLMTPDIEDSKVWASENRVPAENHPHSVVIIHLPKKNTFSPLLVSLKMYEI